MVSSGDDSSEAENLDDTNTPPAVIKNLRKTARRHFTEERNAITTLCDNEGDLALLIVRGDNLKRLYDNCVDLQNRYIAKLDQEDEQLLEVERKWCRKLSDDYTDTRDMASGYKLAKGRELAETLKRQVEEATNGLEKITTPSREKEHGDLITSTPKTPLLTPMDQEAAAIALAIENKRRRLEQDLESSRIREERKRADLKKKAQREELELKEKLAAAGGSFKTPPPRLFLPVQRELIMEVGSRASLLSHQVNPTQQTRGYSKNFFQSRWMLPLVLQCSSWQERPSLTSHLLKVIPNSGQCSSKTLRLRFTMSSLLMLNEFAIFEACSIRIFKLLSRSCYLVHLRISKLFRIYGNALGARSSLSSSTLLTCAASSH